jgi:glutathione S-transferase
MLSPARDLMPENPLAKIPTLVLDDGTVLYDSQVVCEYLDHLGGGRRLIPPPGPARWLELQRHALADGFLDLLILWRNERDKPQPLPALLDAFAESPVGIAQITIATAGAYMDFRFADLGWRERCPRPSAWQLRFAERQCMRATPIADA